MKFELTLQLKLKTGDHIFKVSKNEREHTVFGYKKNLDKKDSRLSNQMVDNLIDIYLPFDFQLNNEIVLFETEFDKQRKAFYFKVLDSDPNILIQIRIDPIRTWKVDKQDKFLFGDMIFKLEPSDKSIVITRLVTKRYTDKIVKTFSENDGKITIGRYKNCSLPLDCSLMSRIHATVQFNSISDCWELKDGETNKPSANGCFVFTTNKVEVSDKLEIKVNENTAILYLN